ncbi:DUF2283 domain-containing protein [Bacillaceae bacterium SIJ1]|uniref:DUF2283 domain-containing protein n=1 Tax=Litoribacterium kuwaitense TaxID=1398745 RepID=UPI0013EBCEB6|nr:DUF2283 domain-containing protein [Litoribacterium kuwaitense]NGP45076.1 DUF2283 domain-containing protein [Litoribacterium kuwaitense]
MNTSFDHMITFDTEVDMAYIHLTEPLKCKITSTEEVSVNHWIMVDMGREAPIIGIELDGPCAKKIQAVPLEDRTFTTASTRAGERYFFFRLDQQPIKNTFSFQGREEVKFLFADEACTDFIGVEVYGDNPYYDAYLSR